MGCFLSKNPSSVEASSTSTIITISGNILEYSTPIQSNLICETSYFLCNSDYLFYNERIPAIGPKEFILPGHLYFILPLKMLDFPLSWDDMGMLATKANNAMQSKSKGKVKATGQLDGAPFVKLRIQNEKNRKSSKGLLSRPSRNLSTIEEVEE